MAAPALISRYVNDGSRSQKFCERLEQEIFGS